VALVGAGCGDHIACSNLGQSDFAGPLPRDPWPGPADALYPQ
jgi:hypothetical protein